MSFAEYIEHGFVLNFISDTNIIVLGGRPIEKKLMVKMGYTIKKVLV